MKKKLRRNTVETFHYVGNVRKEGPPTGVSGDLSGVRGDLSECEITEEDRRKGIKIKELIED